MSMVQWIKAAALSVALFTTQANAGVTPYPTPGTPIGQDYSFVATETGDIVAYFAGVYYTTLFNNEITMLVNGVETGIQGLNNKTSKIGDSIVLGSVKSGDSIIFKLIIAPTYGQFGPYYSTQSMNPDGLTRVYATEVAASGVLPAGMYVSFEDFTDFNYHDESFIFTNLSVAVPEPGSIALLLIAAAGLGIARRRRA